MFIKNIVLKIIFWREIYVTNENYETLPLSICFLLLCSRKQERAPALTRKTWKKHLASAWANPFHCGHVGSKLWVEDLSLCPSNYFYASTFQINELFH